MDIWKEVNFELYSPDNRVNTIKWYLEEMATHGLPLLGSLTDKLFNKINLH